MLLSGMVFVESGWFGVEKCVAPRHDPHCNDHFVAGIDEHLVPGIILIALGYHTAAQFCSQTPRFVVLVIKYFLFHDHHAKLKSSKSPMHPLQM